MIRVHVGFLHHAAHRSLRGILITHPTTAKLSPLLRRSTSRFAINGMGSSVTEFHSPQRGINPLSEDCELAVRKDAVLT
jgi:hypothetical protein